jgi:hypothetical protein
MTGELSTIDWNSGDIINNNFDDYAFRGDPEMAVIIEYIIEQDKQDDCAVKFVKESLQLTPLPTSETINGRTFSRSSAQIPGIYQYTQVERWIANDRSIDGIANARMTMMDPIADQRSEIYIHGNRFYPSPNPYPINPYNLYYPRRFFSYRDQTAFQTRDPVMPDIRITRNINGNY